jgi:hypothetical protein
MAFHNVLVYLCRVVSFLTNSQAVGLPIVGCPQLVIQYIYRYPPYQGAVFRLQPEDALCCGDKRHLTWIMGSLIMQLQCG